MSRTSSVSLILACAVLVSLGVPNQARASVEVHLDNHKLAPLHVPVDLKGLDFSSDAAKRRSVADINRFLVRHKAFLGLRPSDGRLRFDEPHISSFNGQTILLFRQTLPLQNDTGKAIPIAGADVRVVVDVAGRLSRIHSGVVPVAGLRALPADRLAVDLDRGLARDEWVRLGTALVRDANTELVNFLERLQKRQNMTLRTASGEVFRGRLGDYFNADPARHVPAFFAQLSETSIRRFHLTLKSRGEIEPMIDKGTIDAETGRYNPEFVWRLARPFGAPIEVDLKPGPNGRIVLHRVAPTARHAVQIGVFDAVRQDLKGQPVVYVDSTIDEVLRNARAISPANESARAAAVVMSGIAVTVKNATQRESYDGKGAPILTFINATQDKVRDNAAWIGKPTNAFILGAGGRVFDRLDRAVDVLAHEYTHAVIDTSTGLLYRGESGALNEHLADVVGVGIESELLQRPVDFTIGESALTTEAVRVARSQGLTPAIRNMLTPESALSPQPATLIDVKIEYRVGCKPAPENDQCGVHDMSGVPNKAVGQIVRELGWAKTRPMIYDVLLSRLRSDSNFSDYARQLTESCLDVAALTSTSWADCEIVNSRLMNAGLEYDPGFGFDDAAKFEERKRRLCSSYLELARSLGDKARNLPIPENCKALAAAPASPAVAASAASGSFCTGKPTHEGQLLKTVCEGFNELGPQGAGMCRSLTSICELK